MINMVEEYVKNKVAIGISTPSLNHDRFKKCYDALKKNTNGYYYELLIFENTPPKDEIFNYSYAVNSLFKGIPDADYYVILNADLYVEPDWLNPLIETTKQDKNIGIVAPLTFHSNGTVQHGGGELKWNDKDIPTWDKIVQLIPSHLGFNSKPKLIKTLYNQRDCIFVTGALMLITKDCIKKIGMWDENLRFGWNDVEYCLRAWEHDIRVVYQPKSRCVHDGELFMKELYGNNRWEVYYLDPWRKLYNKRWTKESFNILIEKVNKSNKDNYGNLKTLIVTTGTEEYILNRYLSSLRNKGQYIGDILFVNYLGTKGEFNEETLVKFKEDDRIIVYNTTKEHGSFSSDRHKAFAEALDGIYQNYDVIMHTDGNDIEFVGPINSILQKGMCGLTVVEEKHTNNICFSYWKPIIDRMDKEYWNCIKNKRIFNTGVFLGPSEEMFKIFNILSALLEKENDFGADQLFFNVLCYYYGEPYHILNTQNSLSILGINHYLGALTNKPKPLEDLKGLNNNVKPIIKGNEWKKFRYPC